MKASVREHGERCGFVLVEAGDPFAPGHTLIELLLALAVIGVCVAMPVVSLTKALAGVEAGTAARVWEGGASAAQLHAIWSGSVGEVIASENGVQVTGGGSKRSSAALGGASTTPRVNVRRWEAQGSVTVRFLPDFGSPDAAGSLYFGVEGTGQRVILRVESGLTRRVLW